MICLIALDLDGTLFSDGENRVPPVVADAIRRTAERGTIVTLATGRPYAFTRAVAIDLGLTAPLICYQGGIVQTMDGHLLRDFTFSQETLAPALDLARRNRWQVYLERDGVLHLEAEVVYDETLFPLMASPCKRERDLGLADLAPHQLGVFLPGGVTDGQVRDLQDAIGPAATVMRSHPQVINAIPAGVSKGAALTWLADHLGIPQSAVMAVGDSDNDASMISWAGIGVAMGGARASVLEAADWVAPPLEVHGVVAALERYVLSGDGR